MECGIVPAIFIATTTPRSKPSLAEKIQMRLAEYYDKVIPMMTIIENAGIPVVTVDGNLGIVTVGEPEFDLEIRER